MYNSNKQQLICDLIYGLRNLITDNKPMLRTIDDNYVNELMNTINIIPKQYDHDIVVTISIVNIVISNINYTSISNSIRSMFGDDKCNLFKMDMNIKPILEDVIRSKCKDKTTLASYNNLLKKFDPVIKCINHIIATPLKTIHKIASIKDADVDLFN